MSDRGCPCLYVEPCSYACTCAHPTMSGGCERCCRYGNVEQRFHAAQRLAGERSVHEQAEAELLDHCERLRTALHALVPTHSGTMATCADLGCIQHRELKARIAAGLASGSQRRGDRGLRRPRGGPSPT